MRHSAAYDWRRIYSATPQRNALTCRDRCASCPVRDVWSTGRASRRLTVLVRGLGSLVSFLAPS